MVTEDPLKMISELGMRPLMGGSGDTSFGDELEKELGAFLREQRRREASDRESELNLFRSGSAPPTVEGSLSAVGGLFGCLGDSGDSDLSKQNGFLSEEELRSDPAYLSYYYSHVNLNPRLPPPVLSKEDWRFAQRLQAGSSGFGGIGDKRKIVSSCNKLDDGWGRSLFSSQPGFISQNDESDLDAPKPQSSEWLERGGDGLIGLSSLGLGGRKKSFAEMFQEDLGHGPSILAHPSRPSSRNACDGTDAVNSAEAQFAHMQHEFPGGSNKQVSGNVQGINGSASQSYASALGASLSRSTTPDPQLVARVPSPRLPPVGDRLDKKAANTATAYKSNETSDLVAAFSGMNLSPAGVVDETNHLKSQLHQEVREKQNLMFELHGGQNNGKHCNQKKLNGAILERKVSNLLVDGSKITSANSYMKGSPSSNGSRSCGSPSQYQTVDSLSGYGLGGYSINQTVPSMMANQLGSGSLSPLFENAAITASAVAGTTMDSCIYNGSLQSMPNLTGAAADLHNLNRMGNHAAATIQMPLVDPVYLDYVHPMDYAAQLASGLNDPLMDRAYLGNSYVDLLGLQKAYLGTPVSPQKAQYGMPFGGKSSSLSNGFYGNPAFGLGIAYPGSPVLSPSPVGPGSPLRHGERNMRFTGVRGYGGTGLGSWHSDANGSVSDGFTSSLLEEFKSNKTKCFELSEIVGHVVEFSADQYGSRFIQQKLETATTEEKNMVFKEIIPQALSLMTDVFGNYVIQKFFEHGTATQRRELANQLTGHVLTLSLQMYGCRVIQKAIEVVDLDQQTKMVAELDGHVMRCVRDQNGNHVIQKCIECIPQEAILFIISSFYDQVVTLSTHPYGCRVIQRVLEHCDDPTTQKIVMDEILQCVCMLAQDQYGNYVVQHVLEHGKPHERSAIIKKLAGQIVQMSQQKFASNVVEKCLIFGGPIERQILVNEMLGNTDENEPLQAMMKDQFANYVVQKVLETCDDQHRELILSRIKVHLNALKKYTYGKHIVARVEKLVAAGEKRLGTHSVHLPS